MISSHSVDALFVRQEQSAQADVIIEAARTYARALTDNVPQSPALERALSYAQISMLVAIHGTRIPL